MRQLAEIRQLPITLPPLQPAKTAPGMASPNPKGRRGKEQADNSPPVTDGPNSQQRILRRIKRDHPDIAAQVERGDAEHP